jgi:hypothetical protein
MLDKTMKVRPVEGQLEVSSREIRPYRLDGNWRTQLQEWRNAGWEIEWTA